VEVARWGGATSRPREARGCEACAGSGYRGRRGIYELFVPDDATRHDVVAGTSATVLRTRAIAQGTVPLREEGWRLVREGVTTAEELVRALGDVDG
jgi:type II secretory ATPase GspE/PulE/Tfp pilus assembly ATPase PilB-like protein